MTLPVTPYARQHITPDDIDAVSAVLRSDFLTQGPVVPRFEAATAAACGAAHALATCNATAALHLACLALGLGEGDWLWTSPITFVASANCARYCGAQVDWVDVERDSGLMCPIALARKLEQAERAGCLPKIVVPVHLAGQPCDLAAIHALAQRYGFHIVEDAAHAIGASYRGEPIGNGCYSDCTVLSFHPVKIITTGEGGMVLTPHAALARRLALLRSHGITRDPLQCADRDGDWYYEQQVLGYNYRLTDMQAALGASQLTRLGDYVARRRALAARYDVLLSGLPLRPLARVAERESSWHLYVIRLDPTLRPQRRTVFTALRAAGIGVNLHYIPLYRQPYYRSLTPLRSAADWARDYPNAESYYAEAITLPMYVGLNEAEQDRVVATLRAVFDRCGTSPVAPLP